ncbi:hypothetical protein CANARDRAFT_9534 [[Candida] arabinofermentans NRRL YB-2248]|uniref:Uncharacterized protein n=1 Tax=[Candida] arabinofermentans NRRL YB-2248 TaxID=983967 RepID=A0A1E4SVE4_9ASCO|nr:hypothetical protein CANARDRAFT_9534 [[Candida] arabinofermentans NRRL YB-2248]
MREKSIYNQQVIHLLLEEEKSSRNMNGKKSIPLKDITERFERKNVIEKSTLFSKALFNKAQEKGIAKANSSKNTNSQLLAKLAKSYSSKLSDSSKISKPGNVGKNLRKTAAALINSPNEKSILSDRSNESYYSTRRKPIMNDGNTELSSQFNDYLTAIYSMNSVLKYSEPLTRLPLKCQQVKVVNAISSLLLEIQLDDVPNGDKGILLGSFKDFAGTAIDSSMVQVNVGDYIHLGTSYYEIKIGQKPYQCYYRWFKVI